MEEAAANAIRDPGRRRPRVNLREFVARTAEVLRASGALDAAIRVGDGAPDFTLPDMDGAPVTLSQVWREGPVVVILYRGRWCDVCMRQLGRWQACADHLERWGASLIAISPDAPETLRDTIRAHGLSCTLLSDPAVLAARAFRAAMSVPPELIDLYAQAGADAAILDEDGRWEVPIPATFLIDRGGRIRFAHMDLDPYTRTTPDAVFVALRQGVARGG